MESRTSRNEESRSRNNNSPRQGPLISVVCILYFVIVYSATGLILMTFFWLEDLSPPRFLLQHSYQHIMELMFYLEILSLHLQMVLWLGSGTLAPHMHFF